MKRITIKHKSEQEWLADREKDITSTDSSALYGLSPYTTAWELWHTKRGLLESGFQDNERAQIGRMIEDVIAKLYAERTGNQIRRKKAYMRISELRMGSSFDYEIVNHARGPGLLECKNVDYLVWRDQWHKGEQIPPHIEIQAQHEMHVANRDWLDLAILVGGNQLNIVPVDRNQKIGAALEKKITSFWNSQEPPEPDYEKDADAIRRYYSDGSGAPLSIDDDSLIEQYSNIAGEISALDKRKKSISSQILMEISNASMAISSRFKLVASNVAGSDDEYIEVTNDMIGQKIKVKSGRAGYRNFRVYELKGNKNG